jgi:predicted PurR-regulated permease PerM
MAGVSGKTRSLRSDIVFAFGLALACALAWLVRDVLMLLYVSALFAVVLTPVVGKIANLRIRGRQPFKRIAILVMLVGAAAALTAFGFLAIPPVLRDLQQFAGEMPTRVPALLSKLKAIPLADHLNTDEITAKVQDFASQAATYLILSIRDWAGNLLDIAMGLILTIYFMLEGEHAYRWKAATGWTRRCGGRRFGWANGCLRRAA